MFPDGRKNCSCSFRWICYLPAWLGPYREKLFPYTDRARPVNNVFIFPLKIETNFQFIKKVGRCFLRLPIYLGCHFSLAVQGINKTHFLVNAFVVHSSVIMTAKCFEKINENTYFESTCSTRGAVQLRGPYRENRTARQPIRTRDSVGNRPGKNKVRLTGF